MNGATSGGHEAGRSPLHESLIAHANSFQWSPPWTINSAALGRRRSTSAILGALLALLVLLFHSYNAGASSSPRAIVQQGWQHAHDSYRGQFPVDGLRNFIKGPDGDFSSLDLHHPYSPLCRDRKTLLEAMSGGGRLGFDLPYWSRGCDMQWFEQDEICEILSRFDNIYLIGDSMIRHVAQVFHIFMRGDLMEGALKTWEKNPEAQLCKGEKSFDDKWCTEHSILNTDELFKYDPDSIKCSPKKRPARAHFIPLVEWPIDSKSMAGALSRIKHVDEANGREVFITLTGAWNGFDIDAGMAWLEQVDYAVTQDIPAYSSRALDFRLLPKLFVAPSAQGELKPDFFATHQNNIRLQKFTHGLAPFGEVRGYEQLALFNLTVQATSLDATHASFKNNIHKGMMILNWLNMLDPPIDPNAGREPLDDLWDADVDLDSSALPGPPDELVETLKQAAANA